MHLNVNVRYAYVGDGLFILSFSTQLLVYRNSTPDNQPGLQVLVQLILVKFKKLLRVGISG